MLAVHERSSVEKIMCVMKLNHTSDEVIEISENVEGVTLEKLRPCDMIHARTCNSDYEIFLLDPESGRALVRGGKYFVEPTEAIVSGSNFGGSMLKSGWLGHGLRMEFNVKGYRIATSPIMELRVEHGGLGVDNLVVDSSVLQ